MTNQGPVLDSGDNWVEKLGSTAVGDKAGVTDSANTDLFMTHGNGTVSGSVIKDEDDMVSNSDDHLATQQSIKAYVDASGVSISGVPVDDDYAKFTDANTIEGRSYAEMQTDLGFVDTSGTPADNDFAKFTDANTIEGRSSVEMKTDLGYMTDLIDDTTPQLGGDLDLSGNDILMDSNETLVWEDVPTTSVAHCGIKITGQTIETLAGQSISVGSLVFLATNGNWQPANATSIPTMLCAGVSLTALATAPSTTEAAIFIKGFITNSAWATLTVGSSAGGLCYVDTTDGALTQTAPSITGDIVQCIGYARGAQTIWFEPGWTYTTAP